MSIMDRISRLVRGSANKALDEAENQDPMLVLDQAIRDMQVEYQTLQQDVGAVVASRNRLQDRAKEAQAQVDLWLSRAQQAVKQGQDDLARQALQQKKQSEEVANTYRTQHEQLVGQVATMKQSLMALESKISEYRTKKDLLKARLSKAKALEKVHGSQSRLRTDSSAATFERMENHILEMEAKAEALGELASSDLESQFAQLESSSAVDAELAALKASTLEPTMGQGQLPGTGATVPQLEAGARPMDQELEQLKAEIDRL